MSWSINGGGGSGGSPPFNPSALTSLSMRYPKAIDDVPALVNDETIVTAIWVNFLQTMIETVESIIGPIGTSGTDEASWVAGQPNLMTVLDRISSASNPTSQFPAGRLVGFERMVVKNTVRSFTDAFQAIQRIVPFEPNPRYSPVVFCTMQRTNQADESQLSATEMERSCIAMRGWAAWRTSTPRTYDLVLRGITYQGNRAPSQFNLDQERIAHIAILYFQQ